MTLQMISLCRWLSIAATTLSIRIMLLPVLVYQMKATARLTLLRPELERITNSIKESGYDPKVTEVNQARMKALFQKHKTNPFTPLMGAFLQAPIFISFFFAIRNMAEKVPSFKEGGALWFTDLTTPDSFFILPVMSGLATLLTVEVLSASILPPFSLCGMICYN
jgi:YidC/Oxa1 family membrane protein insertase